MCRDERDVPGRDLAERRGPQEVGRSPVGADSGAVEVGRGDMESCEILSTKDSVKESSKKAVSMALTEGR